MVAISVRCVTSFLLGLERLCTGCQLSADRFASGEAPRATKVGVTQSNDQRGYPHNVGAPPPDILIDMHTAMVQESGHVCVCGGRGLCVRLGHRRQRGFSRASGLEACKTSTEVCYLKEHQVLKYIFI